ncbi:hypothetical protein [uncultured Chryseobacterium sp.]|uniref:hypothetical protein n=1 Tax=uncultured Chryseobacterium sp. TaxID=259322 RepID=UPI0025EE4C92|nr:hypothetical protein [uncultured Chryseobacterium sp.]
MRKIYLSALLLSITAVKNNLNAQSNIDKALPNIQPPSAETYKISTYNLDFNNSPSGEFTYNLPIYSLGAGVSIPISLGYNSGVRVDDIGGSLRMSWQLSAGGAISRIVRDEQDETSASVWFPETIDINADANTIRAAAHPDNSIDTEYDWFSFSLSNGLSGQFYIDKSLNVHYNGGDGSKLIITDKTTMHTQYGKNLEFILTDNQGNKYYFGGEEKFLERSRNNYKGPDKYYTSGWYLAKVVTPKNEIINFDYTVEETSYYASMGASFTISEMCCVEAWENSGLTKNKTTLFTFKPRLSSIDDDLSKINFNYTKQRKDYINGSGRLLTSIEVLSKKNNRIIKNFQLSYDDVAAASAATYYNLAYNEQSTVNRHFLNNVNDIISGQKYKFEYYSKENIPARFSLATDFYGYFNGKSNQTPFANIAGQVPNHIIPKANGWASANKEVDPGRNFFGNLKRVYYPTGGFSDITYESNSSLAEVPVEKFETSNLAASRNCTGARTVSNSLTFTSNGSPVSYTAYASTDHSTCGEPDELHEIHGVQIKDLTTGSVVRSINKKYYEGIEANNNVCFSSMSIDQCPVETISGHQYEIKYSVTSYLGKISGSMSVNYNSHFENENVLIHYGGSRVKKIENNNNGNGIYTRWFYYNTLQERLSQKTSIANAPTRKFFQYLMTIRNCKQECDISSNTEMKYSRTPIAVYRFFKDNITTDFNDRSNKIFYSSITEIVEGKQAVEKSYLYEDDNTAYAYDPQVLDAPHSNNGQLKRGLLKNEKHFDFRNNAFTLLKETDNTYTYIQSAVKSFIFKENFNFNTGYIYNTSDGPIPNISYTFYQNYFGYSKLNETLSKEYINGSILNTKVNTTYEPNQHHQPILKKVTHPDLTFSETTYSYAHEKNNQLMIAKNMTGIPLETTTTQTIGGVTKTLGKTETIYPASLPTSQAGNLVLPLSSVSYNVLNNASSTEATYDKYDDKGNLLQYTGKDGIPVSIIWGYSKTQPIAKVEGMTYDQLMAAVSIAGIVTASDNDEADPAKEGLLLDALSSFRKEPALSGKPVSTYTYDPLIGVTSITPPSGVRQSYTYDAAGRLKEGKVRSKDNSGSYINKKVSENNYNYKP